MKTLDELKTFTTGYINGMNAEDIPEADDWVVWGGYDINLCGNVWAGPYNMGADQLYVIAYPDGWTEALPDPIHIFVTTKE